MNERLKKIIEGRRLSKYHKNYIAIHVVEDLLQQEISIAKKEERERIVEMIDSHVISLEADNAVHKIFGEGYTKARNDFINLITNNE